MNMKKLFKNKFQLNFFSNLNLPVVGLNLQVTLQGDFSSKKV